MKIDVSCYSRQTIDIDEREALRILCKTLEMEWILEEDNNLVVIPYDDGTLSVYTVKDGKYTAYDDRGELFVALSNLIVQMFPNVEFRGASYIWDFEKGCFNGELKLKGEAL